MLRHTAEDCRKKRTEETLDFEKKVDEEAFLIAENIAEKIYNKEGCNKIGVLIETSDESVKEAVLDRTIQILRADGYTVEIIKGYIIEVSV